MPSTIYDRAMRLIFWLPFPYALMLVLTGCANHGGAGNDPVGTGPFDSNGNYREEWANDPAKWRKPGKSAPTANDDLPVVTKNEQPPPNANPLAPQTATPPKTSSSHGKSTAQASTRHTDEHKTTSSKPKPHTTRSSSSSTRHVVKKGDSLSSLAHRYHTSVSAIQKANNLSGTLIRDGKSLVIPKR